MTPTPGQIAYAAYCRVVYGVHVRDDDYADLTWGQHDAWEAAAQAVRALGVPRTFAEKSSLNQWAAARYDALMQEGKHGHYETMFRVIQEALAQAVLALKQEPAPAMVHALRAGMPRCGFSREAPVHWPAGHCWSASHDDITCQACQEVSHD